jgi:hypothetical protein
MTEPARSEPALNSLAALLGRASAVAREIHVVATRKQFRRAGPQGKFPVSDLIAILSEAEKDTEEQYLEHKAISLAAEEQAKSSSGQPRSVQVESLTRVQETTEMKRAPHRDAWKERSKIRHQRATALEFEALAWCAANRIDADRAEETVTSAIRALAACESYQYPHSRFVWSRILHEKDGCTTIVRHHLEFHPLIDSGFRRVKTATQKAVHALRKLEARAGSLQRDCVQENRAAKHKPLNEARDKWIYEKCFEDKTYLEVIGDLRREIESQQSGSKWAMITTPQGIRRAAMNYAEWKELPQIPIRHDR